MLMQPLTCRCGEIIVKSVGGGSKVRSKILIIKAEGLTVAVCKGCGVEVPIPLKLDSEAANPPLFVRPYKSKI